MVEEQEWLRHAARKAEEAMAQKAEEMASLAACAARFRKQLDFLEGRDRRLLQSELECLELVESMGARSPDPPPGSPSSFSDVLGVIDWPSLEPLDVADGRN